MFILPPACLPDSPCILKSRREHEEREESFKSENVSRTHYKFLRVPHSEIIEVEESQKSAS